jgi:hypothetical protein
MKRVISSIFVGAICMLALTQTSPARAAGTAPRVQGARAFAEKVTNGPARLVFSSKRGGITVWSTASGPLVVRMQTEKGGKRGYRANGGAGVRAAVATGDSYRLTTSGASLVIKLGKGKVEAGQGMELVARGESPTVERGKPALEHAALVRPTSSGRFNPNRPLDGVTKRAAMTISAGTKSTRVDVAFTNQGVSTGRPMHE